jgi:hypothetical protein
MAGLSDQPKLADLKATRDALILSVLQEWELGGYASLEQALIVLVIDQRNARLQLERELFRLKNQVDSVHVVCDDVRQIPTEVRR